MLRTKKLFAFSGSILLYALVLGGIIFSSAPSSTGNVLRIGAVMLCWIGVCALLGSILIILHDTINKFIIYIILPFLIAMLTAITIISRYSLYSINDGSIGFFTNFIEVGMAVYLYSFIWVASFGMYIIDFCISVVAGTTSVQEVKVRIVKIARNFIR